VRCGSCLKSHDARRRGFLGASNKHGTRGRKFTVEPHVWTTHLHAHTRRETMFTSSTLSTTVAPRARFASARASASRMVANTSPLSARVSQSRGIVRGLRSTTRRRSAARLGSAAVRAAGDPTPPLKKPQFSNNTKMRSEAQAPFRVARMFFFGAFGANATLGFGIATLQAVTKALGAPNGPPLDQSLQNLGINLACALFFGYFYKRDADGRDKQMARISREERLSDLQCELAGGKRVSLYDLRGFSRVVVAAGDATYCNAAIEAAEAFRDPLVERGVLLIPVIIAGDEDTRALPPVGDDDRRFRASPVAVHRWRTWLEEQKAEAKVSEGKGVYVGLRMDGRVRSSGTGVPPWERFSVELPPTDSWGGVMDGFDGRVGVDA